MNIVILGPQGSGKGTQAGKIAEKFDLYLLGTGKMLREMATTNPKLKKELSGGSLLPDNEIFELVTGYLEEKGIYDGIIFDGYPRSHVQFHAIRDWLKKKGKNIDLVILIQISDTESIRRLTHRRMDKSSGKIYNLLTNPPGNEIDKNNLVQRDDDKEDAIKKRLEEYHNTTEVLVNELRKNGELFEVDGERPIKEIEKELTEKLKSLIK